MIYLNKLQKTHNLYFHSFTAYLGFVLMSSCTCIQSTSLDLTVVEVYTMYHTHEYARVASRGYIAHVHVSHASLAHREALYSLHLETIT